MAEFDPTANAGADRRLQCLKLAAEQTPLRAKAEDIVTMAERFIAFVEAVSAPATPSA